MIVKQVHSDFSGNVLTKKKDVTLNETKRWRTEKGVPDSHKASVEEEKLRSRRTTERRFLLSDSGQ